MHTVVDKFGCVGSTIKVAAGHYVDLLDPDPDTLDLSSIAVALGQTCRFGGHTPQFYSVAEHCFHAVDLAHMYGEPDAVKRAVVLHDAAEAFIGDVVKPLKNLLGNYSEIEARFEAAIGSRFGVNFEKYAERIKFYDRMLLKAEKMALWPEDAELWQDFGDLPDVSVDFAYLQPERATALFLSACLSLGLE